MLQLPPRLRTVDSELNRQFQQAALNSSAESDPFFSNVSIRFVTPSPSLADQDPDQVPTMHGAFSNSIWADFYAK